MHRFFIAPELIQGDSVHFPADLAHQITRVLRLREQDRVIVLDNSGQEWEVELHSLGKRSVDGTLVARRPNLREPHTSLTLYIALLKGKKNDLVLQKATELGVTRFVPILTNRSVVGSLRDLSDAKVDRWESVVREAAEQSERGRLPIVSEPLLLDSALSEARQSEGLALVAWEEQAGQSIRQVLNQQVKPPTSVKLFVGPEGGFEEDEILHARAYGVIPVTLGPRILRAETAAIAAAAVILYELGEWESR
jgi:16S rRNA (uracil1498-N3)-methyltransferase